MYVGLEDFNLVEYVFDSFCSLVSACDLFASLEICV